MHLPENPEEEEYDAEMEPGDGSSEEEEYDTEMGDGDDSRSNGATRDLEEETVALQPLRMYFPSTVYGNTIRIATRCYIAKAVDTLEKHLDEGEKKWFYETPQFAHFFHMRKGKNHWTMAMWMLLLRTAWIEKTKEVWFVVNGVPIRYSMREHALLSGLICHHYPEGYEELGNRDLVDEYFGNQKVTHEAVEEKLLSMKEASENRLKMAVLYFLSSVIKGNAKSGKDAAPVDELFQRFVGDLRLCRTFPWGRFSFLDNLREIKHMLEDFDGVAKPSWTYPSFVIPLELLAYEAIPALMSKFREEVRGAHSGCPRMCKTSFRSGANREFSIGNIYKTLGTTKVIESILAPTFGEEALLSEIMNGSDEDDVYDVIVDGWTRRLLVEKKPIWFKEMYTDDQNGRKKVKKKLASPGLGEVMEMLVGIHKKIDDMDGRLDTKIDAMDRRLKALEEVVKEFCKGNV